MAALEDLSDLSDPGDATDGNAPHAVDTERLEKIAQQTSGNAQQPNYESQSTTATDGGRGATKLRVPGWQGNKQFSIPRHAALFYRHSTYKRVQWLEAQLMKQQPSTAAATTATASASATTGASTNAAKPLRPSVPAAAGPPRCVSASIGVLMALGIFAAAASIVKAVVAADFGKTDDPNLEGISVGMWSLVEEQVAFIAACIPC
ncbi:hypothetical protein B0T24DRAFT_712202 [Lasiosphaeria ovina]|uniref:Rhodopsin domain-containing protein n=1 Tax=Lasiosphaeria ovina TaxID=92902 RepID=A0AAE0JUW6_9PEZI|nr:hypothetical protein B0T24DRAFT_712202 [Lasiosphaeria ovina]